MPHVTDELRKKLASLRAVAPELNKATDKASAVVQSVEKLLGEELSLGVSATTTCYYDNIEPSKDSDDGHALVRDFLVYGRLDGKYRIHIVRTFADADSSEPLAPDLQFAWQSATREDKLRSFARLPELIGEIADEAKRLTDQSMKTVAEVLNLLDEIPEIATSVHPKPVITIDRKPEKK